MNEIVIEKAPCVRDHFARPHALDGGVPRVAVADIGLLCTNCMRRLEWLLDDAPDIIRAARAAVPLLPGAAGGSEPVSGTKERPLPFDAGALEDADDLFAMVANWATAIAAALGVEPPADLEGVAAIDANVNGLAAGTAPETAAAATERIVRWLLGRLPDVAGMPMVGEMAEEVVPALERMSRRWLQDGREPKLLHRSLPCPSCAGHDVRAGCSGDLPKAWCAGCLLALPVDWTVMS
ncbi:hypothetical protein L332_03505 [Agrococcus pavilionensis RW1]|uniref:Uncharacterized protein n=1 Tax=Agrococcus pavilionensis RW1 TaxID=1330458 RepID=U1MS78_9MICO|nr:hypothetical protein [Agrococcus pavilionensis]ERG63520.1 hypothetical protein L332_03505 [Agrococcus pavilionensis RW1]